MYFCVLYLGPINKISCFTSFHSQNARAAGGYLYLLFNLLLVYLVAYLSTFIDNFQKANSAHLPRARDQFRSKYCMRAGM